MWNEQEIEERDFHVASESELDLAEAYERGAANPEAAYVLTGRGMWHNNPYYSGPAVPHPEDDSDDYYQPVANNEPRNYSDNDEIPF